jgi:hypothetical protein
MDLHSMSLTTRRGLTLVDLLIALVLFGLLGTAVARALVGQRRAAGMLLEREQAHRTLDQAVSWLSTELAELGRADSVTDLLRIGADSMSYRAFRSAGLACLVAADEVRVRRDQLSLWRMPQPGRDSLLLFLAVDSAPGSGKWTALPITSLSWSSCSGLPAMQLGTIIDTARLAGLPHLVPARTFEAMQLRLYRSQGEWWLGARSQNAGEVIQPVTGPFAERGFRLTYRDAEGREVLEPALVRQLELHVAPARLGDSARLVIQPRNLQ